MNYLKPIPDEIRAEGPPALKWIVGAIFWICGLIGAVGIVWTWLNPQGPGKILASLFGILTVLLGSVILHELGHLLAGFLLGFRPVLLSIGMGDQLCQFCLGGLTVALRQLPIAGMVVPLEGRTPGRLAWAVFVAAGPLVNIALLVVAGQGWHHGLHRTGTWYATPIKYLAAINLLILFENLIPWTRTRDGQDVLSDGAQLLRLLQKSKE